MKVNSLFGGLLNTSFSPSSVAYVEMPRRIYTCLQQILHHTFYYSQSQIHHTPCLKSSEGNPMLFKLNKHLSNTHIIRNRRNSLKPLYSQLVHDTFVINEHCAWELTSNYKVIETHEKKVFYF